MNPYIGKYEIIELSFKQSTATIFSTNVIFILGTKYTACT